MKSYILNTIGTNAGQQYGRFDIVYYTGLETDLDRKWMVTSGTCFKTFTYDTGSGGAINIKGLHSGFKWETGQKVYLDFDISPNLQVTGCSVKCTKVGKDSQYKTSKDASIPEWADFPNMFRIVPKDEIDEKTGLVKKITEGKRQTKAYLLLGTRSDDVVKTSGTSGTASNQFIPLKKANSNVIMMISQVSGVPVVFPMPWFASMNPDDNF